eukprot:scpid61972/ scgid9202/ Multidrug resistance protein 1A; ATP-binding cassette sub-family B member 1A; MDR1A; Multidrug resistance protein 3; P-glycoprotein 3
MADAGEDKIVPVDPVPSQPSSPSKPGIAQIAYENGALRQDTASSTQDSVDDLEPEKPDPVVVDEAPLVQEEKKDEVEEPQKQPLDTIAPPCGDALKIPSSPNPSHGSTTSSKRSVSDLSDEEPKSGGGDGDADGDEAAPLVDQEEGKPELVSTSRLFQYADKFDRIMIFLGCFFGAAHGVFLPAMMLTFGDTISLLSNTAPPFVPNGTNVTNATNNATAVNPLDGLVEKMGDLAIIYCALAAGVLAVTYIQIVAWATVGERLTRRIRKNFFASILNQDLSWFDTHKTGELSSRMSDDLVKVYGGIGDKNGLFFQWIATHVAGLIIGFVKGWKLTLVVLFGGGPFLVASGIFVSKLVSSIGTQEQDAYAKAGAVAGEVLSSVRTVVAFGGENQEAERYEMELEGARKFGVRKGFVTGFGFSVVYLMMFATYGLAFYTGTRFVWNGDMEPGDMVTTFFNVVIACFALGHAAPSMQANAEARGAAVAVYNIIDSVPTINTSSDRGQKPETLEGDFRFEDVHFTYPSRKDVKILDGLNMEIKKGQTTALVGPSGCGKSTCIQLVQRFYDVEDGSVSLDGTDVRDLNVQWLRSHIGVVGQEPILFATTIAENIAYGSLTEVTRDDVIAASKQANAHNFISALPDGYETLVGERGAQMSGGQKQRIAIARALIRNPKILLLDEATSALDTESERIVQSSLEAASKGRTTIVIAHRLTTVRNADQIIALKDGVVEEVGNHNQLMEKKGLYHALVSMQGAVGGGEEESVKQDEAQSKEKVTKKTSDSAGKRKKSVSNVSGKDEEKDEEEEEEDLPPVDTKRILMYNKPEFPTMALGAFSALGFGTVFPLFGIIFAEVLSVFTLLSNPANKDEYFRRAGLWAGMFCVLGLGSFIVLLCQFYFFGRSGAALTKRMRSVAFRAILRQNVAFFDEKSNSTGALTTRLAADAALIQGATGQKIGNIFQLISTLVTALAISFSASWHMTLLIMAVIPLVAAAGAANTKALAGHGSTNKVEYLEAGKTAVEVIDNVRTVVSLGLESRSVERYMAILEPVYRGHKRARHFQALATGMSEATFFFVYAICFAFGAFLIEQGLATFTDVFTVFGSMVFGAFSLGQSAAFAPELSKAGGAAARIFRLLDTVPEIDSGSDEGERMDVVSGNIELKDIKFRYPTRPDVQILDGTTITAQAGQTIALVGQSGCGKSTSVSLLERFYDPEGGVVSVDERDIKTLNLAWWRSQIGIVQQEPVLFDSSIGDNIAYGALDRMVTIEEIHSVAKKSNIHDFIMSLPSGYDTNVGAKGTQLSGGQKQRIAIARALIRNPKILLLDEATSALDTE